MKPKYTPGRWIAFNNGFKIWVKSEDTLKHIGQFVAELTEQADKEKAWADAQLVAAAPLLLEAARNALIDMPTGSRKDALIDALLSAEGGNNE